jgi:SAM-dependent methyltransferase
LAVKTSRTRALARRLVLHPSLGWPIRLVRPGWPDAGRLVVQEPALRGLLGHVRQISGTGGVVVNAGAGEGLYSALVNAEIAPAHLVEFDLQVPDALPAGGTRHRLRASLTEVALAAACADVIVCTEVLEHVPDDRRALIELRRLTRDSGWLLLSVPTPPAVPDSAHVREGYTLEQLRVLLEGAGFAIVAHRFAMHTAFKAVLRHWRAHRVPLAMILGLAWFDRLVPIGSPMDIIVLARAVTAPSARTS